MNDLPVMLEQACRLGELIREWKLA
jgi:hypothetical protein